MIRELRNLGYSEVKAIMKQENLNPKHISIKFLFNGSPYFNDYLDTLIKKDIFTEHLFDEYFKKIGVNNTKKFLKNNVSLETTIKQTTKDEMYYGESYNSYYIRYIVPYKLRHISSNNDYLEFTVSINLNDSEYIPTENFINTKKYLPKIASLYSEDKKFDVYI